MSRARRFPSSISPARPVAREIALEDKFLLVQTRRRLAALWASEVFGVVYPKPDDGRCRRAACGRGTAWPFFRSRIGILSADEEAQLAAILGQAMSTFLQPETREQILEAIAGHAGLHFPPERWPDVERGLRGGGGGTGHRRPWIKSFSKSSSR